MRWNWTKSIRNLFNEMVYMEPSNMAPEDRIEMQEEFFSIVNAVCDQ